MKTLLNKELYKEIKKMDRKEMDEFFLGVYNKGFRDGTEAGNKADFKIKLVTVLQETKGVGEKTIEKVLHTLKKLEEAEETAKNLAVLNRKEQ